MIPADTLVLYIATCATLAIIPGPTMLLALSNGICAGMRKAAWGIVGAGLGSAVLITAVALGLGSLLAASEFLFNGLRIVGIVYLLWLALKMWRSPALDVQATLALPQAVRGRTAFARCFMVSLSNPKAMLFFAAFLPQFVHIELPQGPQYALLGAIFIAIDMVCMAMYACAGTQAMRWLSRRSLRAFNRGCAVAMAVLAGTLAIWRRPGS